MFAGLEERRDTGEAIVVIPNDRVHRLGRIVRHAKGVFEYCTIRLEMTDRQKMFVNIPRNPSFPVLVWKLLFSLEYGMYLDLLPIRPPSLLPAGCTANTLCRWASSWRSVGKRHVASSVDSNGG